MDEILVLLVILFTVIAVYHRDTRNSLYPVSKPIPILILWLRAAWITWIQSPKIDVSSGTPGTLLLLSTC
jgi:hypothetical protein